MIITKEPVTPQSIFQAVRTAVRCIHPETAFEEDPCGAPFLFKSEDAKIWVRVFYQSMHDSSPEELENEIAKLMVVMPKDARIYCFYPALSQEQIGQFKTSGDRVVFFEYGGRIDTAAPKAGIRVRKWVPAPAGFFNGVVTKETPAHMRRSVPFLNCARLSASEIEGLTELGLSLRRP